MNENEKNNDLYENVTPIYQPNELASPFLPNQQDQEPTKPLQNEEIAKAKAEKEWLEKAFADQMVTEEPVANELLCQEPVFEGALSSSQTSQNEFSVQDVTPLPVAETVAYSSATSTEGATSNLEQPIAMETNPEQPLAPVFHMEDNKHDKKAKKSRFAQIAAVACLVSVLGGGSVGLGLGFGNQFFANLNQAQQNGEFHFQQPAPQAQAVSTIGQNNTMFNGYADLIEKVEPSVVTISSRYTNNNGLFRSAEATGEGTGILFTENESRYFIATNAHVIDGATTVEVSVAGSKPISAVFVGKDVKADLAVIAVEKEEAKKQNVNKVVLASFGDSDAMRVGDIVLAIGNSLGEGNTATDGIISMKNKEITIENTQLTVFQTNATINSGNSGGPLINIRGEVIGINTAKQSMQANGIVEGTGFAIPSNIIKPIIEGLMTQKPKPVIGISGRTLSAKEAEQYNLPQAGAMVISVVEGYPAQIAGILPNDIITGIDNEPILSMEEMIQVMGKYKIGDTVKVKIIRNGKEYLTLTIELAENKLGNF